MTIARCTLHGVGNSDQPSSISCESGVEVERDLLQVAEFDIEYRPVQVKQYQPGGLGIFQYSFVRCYSLLAFYTIMFVLSSPKPSYVPRYC
ncbi:uncharacterized protein ARMOST_14864 [Armillaria ostoyae]|uniref:Uncharacterized protein n=1 Tax=Armillaria ostoyae TaxID=47428 RepID=A0A284RRS5_ARMOS|nr:uncharacterized protein ARMOST_14864 [Armillaria ostoyae]